MRTRNNLIFLFVLAAVGCGLLLPLGPARATATVSTYVLDPNSPTVAASCAAVGGSWDGVSTCTIGKSFVLGSGIAIDVDARAVLSILKAVNYTVAGSIEIMEGTVANSGTVTITLGGRIDNLPVGISCGSMSSSGAIFSAGTISNACTFANAGVVTSSGNLTNSGGGSLTNSGKLSNAGTLLNTGGTLTNSGTLTNLPGGTMNLNAQAKIINNASAVIDNGAQATINIASAEGMVSLVLNNGTINNNGAINNVGSIESSSPTATINNGGTITNSNGGEIENLFGSTINNNAGATITNGPQCTISSTTGSVINNMGTITNGGEVDNYGTFYNNHLSSFVNLQGATFSNTDGGYFNNGGTLTNGGSGQSGQIALIVVSRGGGIMDFAGGMIVNSPGAEIDLNDVGSSSLPLGTLIMSGGTLANGGVLFVNYGVLQINSGTVTNACGGVVIKLGTISGEPVTDICAVTQSGSAPVISGSVAVQNFSNTGMSVSVQDTNGTTATIETAQLSSQPAGTGTVTLGPADGTALKFYSVGITGITGGAADICITSSYVGPNTTLMYYVTSSWFPAQYIVVAPSSGTTPGAICGGVPVSALSALSNTPLVIGDPQPMVTSSSSSSTASTSSASSVSASSTSTSSASSSTSSYSTTSSATSSSQSNPASSTFSSSQSASATSSSSPGETSTTSLLSSSTTTSSTAAATSSSLPFLYSLVATAAVIVVGLLLLLARNRTKPRSSP